MGLFSLPRLLPLVGLANVVLGTLGSAVHLVLPACWAIANTCCMQQLEKKAKTKHLSMHVICEANLQRRTKSVKVKWSKSNGMVATPPNVC